MSQNILKYSLFLLLNSLELPHTKTEINVEKLN